MFSALAWGIQTTYVTDMLAATSRRISIALAFAALVAPFVQAAPIPYQLTLHVRPTSMIGCEETVAMNMAGKPKELSGDNFGCNWSNGAEVIGLFSLRQDPLDFADGVYRIGLESFSITLGTVVFDISRPSSFEVFMGTYASSCPLSPDPLTDTAPVSGVSVRMRTEGGQAVGFCSVARGPAGLPALQLTQDGPIGQPNRLAAYDVFSGVSLAGTYTIQRLPEPNTAALACIALATGAIAKRRRTNQACSAQ